MNWTPGALDELERAVAEGSRVQLWRRGTEHVVLPERIATERGSDVLHGRALGTGDRVRFRLDEIDHFTVIP